MLPKFSLTSLLVLLACGGEPPLECSEASQIMVYTDNDGDGHGTGKASAACAVGEGFALLNDDCDDDNANVHPELLESCDGIDNNCDDEIDEGLREIKFYADTDEDGYGDPEVKRRACAPPEGYVENDWDCDDTDPNTHPLAQEICDGLDNDCDELIDDADPTVDRETASDWFFDNDFDTYGSGEPVPRCAQPAGTVANDLDCDDANGAINPDAQEVCDGVDNDCDLYTDDSDPDLDTSTQNTYYADYDGDNFGDPDDVVTTCLPPWFYTTNNLDCDDSDPYVNMVERNYWSTDADGDGFSDGLLRLGPSCTPPEPNTAPTMRPTDCDDDNDAVHPEAEEICNGIDDDCDTLVDTDDDSLDLDTLSEWYIDSDDDGYGDAASLAIGCSEPDNAVAIAGDCNDSEAAVNPDAVEICNGGIDDDCDGLEDDTDDDLDISTQQIWYSDFDEDGYGATASAIEACSQPEFYSDVDGDCDDTDPLLGPPSTWALDTDGDMFWAGETTDELTCIRPGDGYAPTSLPVDCAPTDPDSYPGALEVCGDGVDQDCDGEDLECGIPASCLNVLDYNPAAPSGVYLISPHTGGEYEVYCDMVTDNGGWTLVASSTSTLSDESADWTPGLTSMVPSAAVEGVWRGMRGLTDGTDDIRFTCKNNADDAFMRVDLSFYANGWYEEITSGLDFQTCFNENDGEGYDTPAPARRNNLTGSFRPEGDDWDADGYLEGESSCASSEFTVDFDDRGVDGNPSDGTDWGYDGGAKCGVAGSGGAWFIFVRE